MRKIRIANGPRADMNLFKKHFSCIKMIWRILLDGSYRVSILKDQNKKASFYYFTAVKFPIFLNNLLRYIWVIIFISGLGVVCYLLHMYLIKK